MALPVVTVVGLGPAGAELLSERTRALLEGPGVVLRTRVHPAAAGYGHLESFDQLYEDASSFDELYPRIVDELCDRAQRGPVTYVVPGSPLVAERTVELLRADPRVDLVVEPSLSFLDLAWARLGIDPVALGVRTVDLSDLLEDPAAKAPVLVAQTWSNRHLSELKLALFDHARRAPVEVTLLHHLGLDDEVVTTVALADLDRTLEADHLTSVYVAALASPGEAFGTLMALVERLRRECPWDQEQTHRSLARHLLEEAHEVLDALEDLDPAEPASIEHLEEELGDLMVQACFHAVLAAEEGDFTMVDVLDHVTAKLIYRHPHVFGDGGAQTKEEVATAWEELKAAEKQRASVTDGIPGSLPALGLATKLQRKAQAIDLDLGSSEDALERAARALGRLGAAAGASGSVEATAATVGGVGELLLEICLLSQRAGVDPESELRAAARGLRSRIRQAEGVEP